MRINTNLTAMNTFTQYTKNNNKIADSVEKLSSGYAINSAADNAAGLAISEKMRAQIRGLEQASVNSQDAISLIQTAEGGLNESTEILQRMRELAVQSANDTNENEIDREALQDEFSQLQEELNNIASTTTFNKKNLLDGSLAKKQASTANLDLKNAGLSVSLGNVAAGKYTFEAIIKTESAAVASVDPDLTAVSTNSAISASVADLSAASSLQDTSLGNGNYDIEASWNADTKEMTFTAIGDNGQTFTATASEQALKDYATAYAADASTASLAVKFGNGSVEAFTLNLNTATTFSTSNDSTMETVAKEFSDALSVSISGGVDAKEAEYALYATMTGAEDVKLSAGMDSVTFSNGISVSFDELTTSDVTITKDDAKKFDSTLGGADADATKAAATYENKFGAFTAGGTTTTPGGFTAGTATTTSKAMAVGDMSGSSIGSSVAGAINGQTLTFGDISVTFAADAVADGDTGAQAVAKIQTIVDAAVTTNNNKSSGTTDYNAYSSVTVAVDGTSGFKVDYTETPQSYSAGTTTTTQDSYSHAASSFEVQIGEGDGLTFQIGANQGDELVINIDRMDAEYLGVASADILSRENASAALTAVDDALNEVASQRAYLGAMQNRLDHKIANLETSAENLTAAEGQIRDVDMAKEMTEFTNANILSQAATAMLAQANSLPQNVLSLIG